MPPAREQAEKRRLERLRAEVERRDMALQVVDRHERQAPPPRERFRSGQPDEQRADQPRSLRDGNVVDPLEAGLAERLPDDRQHELEVVPRRDLRYHAAEPRVQVRLGRDDVGADFPVLGDHRRGGLVARGLDSEDQRAAGS